jgi:NhaA family Na+:H+ antiporter
MRLQAAGGGVLLAATIVALAAANSPLADRYAAVWNHQVTIGADGASLTYPLWYWINDGLMAVFFFVVGLEIKRELVLGELRDRRNVVLPAIAAIGGALVPIGLYLFLQPDLPGRAGWAIPMATDIAFVVGCLAVLGTRVPPSLKIFMLSLAIIDDVLAVIVIAVAFSASISWLWLVGALAGLMAVVGLDKLGVRRIGVYVFVGVLVWLCTLKSGIHPTIAGVILGLLTPARAWIPETVFVDLLDRGLTALRSEEPRENQREAIENVAIAASESVSPLERLEHGLHPWVAFLIMPLFALANAGVVVSLGGIQEPIAIAVIVGLSVGKPVGIVAASWIAIKLRLAQLPDRVTWSSLLGGGWLCGIGFTMALFIGSLSVAEPALAAAKTGILFGSATSLVFGMTLLTWSLRQPAR